MDQSLPRESSPIGREYLFPNLFRLLTDHSHSGDDVFLNEPASATASSQLSPVAEAFTPGAFLTPSATASRAGGVSSYIPGGITRTGPGVIGSGTPVSNLLSGSVPDDVDLAMAENLARSTAIGPGPWPGMATLVEDSNELAARIDNLTTQLQGTVVSRDLLHYAVVREGTFSTDDQRGRAVLVCGIPIGFPEFAVRSIFTVSLSHSLHLLPSDIFIATAVQFPHWRQLQESKPTWSRHRWPLQHSRRFRG
jgi:hypothetical protein